MKKAQKGKQINGNKSIAIAMLFALLLMTASCGKTIETYEMNAGGETANEQSAPNGEAGPAENQAPAVTLNLATPSTSGNLQVIGTDLCDEAGNPVQLRGLSTHGLGWFPQFVNQDAFNEFHYEWGANVIRLAMYTDEGAGYCTTGDSAAIKQTVIDGVEYAKNADMYVIIDWHILRDGNPNQYKNEAKAFFAEMSSRYADYNNVIYEICNEPNGDVTWADVKAYAEEVIPVIRSNDDNAVIIVGTPTWSQDVDQAAANPITITDNLMYTLHFYAATHGDYLRDRMVAAKNAGIPIFVTEYGICDASGNGALDYASASQWVSLMDQYNISYVCWNISNKNESSALFKESCTSTSGFTTSDMNDEGVWLYELLREKAGITESAAGNEPVESEPEETYDDSASQTTVVHNGDQVIFSADGISAIANLREYWDSDEGMCYLYDLTISNTGSTPMSSWRLDLPLENTVTFQEGWNGVFSLNGKTLTITNESYNGSIAGGGILNDVGFIICGAKL